MKIHNTAIVDGDIHFEGDCEIGPYTILSGNITLGDGTIIGSHTRIEGNVYIGKSNKISSFVYIGGLPQDVNYKNESTYVRIGNNNVIREYVTIHRATGQDKATAIGNNNFIMAYAHLAHNVRVGSNCTIVNAAQLAGYVEVDDYAFISGLVAIHQFARVGRFSIVGGGVRLSQDALPYMMIQGEPARVFGLNIVGLKRNHFDSERIRILKKAFITLCRSRLSLPSAIEQIKKELPMNDDIKYLLDFVTSSKRGVLRKSVHDGQEN